MKTARINGPSRRMSMVDIAVKIKGKKPMKSHPMTATKVQTTTMVKTTMTMKSVKKNGEMVMQRRPITMTNGEMAMKHRPITMKNGEMPMTCRPTMMNYGEICPTLTKRCGRTFPPSFKLYCKKICNENNYKMDSEPTTATTHQGRSANQAETVPNATTVKGKEIAINSLRRLNVTNEGVEDLSLIHI